jgi:putative oxidoreductase
MTIVNRIEDWGNRHHPAIFDIARIILGLFLLLKGYAFLQNLPYLERMLSDQKLSSLSPGAIGFIMFYVIFVHMTGGTLIMLGISTRIASILQLPIIIAAIFVINIFKSPLSTELWYSVACGILLLLFVMIGSGPFSLDNYLNKSKMSK